MNHFNSFDKYCKSSNKGHKLYIVDILHISENMKMKKTKKRSCDFLLLAFDSKFVAVVVVGFCCSINYRINDKQLI